jgi:hypothetical protein
MKISIEYEASWRNSFLDGDNNSSLPKAGREYIASMTSLKEEGNFIQRTVKLDTVMGVLNRLIGDQRKLYQAKEKHGYYFAEIESKISFEDRPILTNEIVYLRNMKGSTDQNSFTGMIKSSDPMFSSNYSRELWGVLRLDLPNLCSFIIGNEVNNIDFDADPLMVCAVIEDLEKLKPVVNEGEVSEALIKLDKAFPGTNYLNNKGLVITSSLYCSALYLQLNRLSVRFDMSSVLTKSGGISGISKRGFTKKDFMDRFTTGRKKNLWGNPYMLKKLVKGQGEVTSMLTKASGQLEITIDVDKQKAQEIKDLIENAGVSAFYLGKKGLAYVSDIRL